MRAGLLIAWNELEFKLRHSYTRRANSNSRHISHLRSWSSRSATNIQSDIDLDIRTWRKDDSPTKNQTAWRATVFGETATAMMEPSVSEFTLLLRFANSRWYVNDDLEYEFVSDSCRLYDSDENLLHEFWTTSTSIIQSHLTPSGLPALGIPPFLWCEQDAILSDIWQPYEPPLWDIPTPGVYTTSAHGGWRFRTGSEWHALPVDYAPEVPRLTPPCCTAAYSEPVASAPDTYSISVEFYQKNLRSLSFACLSEQIYRRTAVMAFPNVSRKIQRMSQPYQSFVRRLSVGDVRLREHTTCFIERLSGTECSFDETVEHEILPSASEMSFTMTDDPHAQEYLFTQRTPTIYERFYSFYSILAGGSEEGDPVGSVCVGGVFDSRSHDQQFPITDAGDLPAWLDVNDSSDAVRSRWARYINSHLNPHWLYYLRFDDWELGLPLTSVDKNQYWIPLRQQWTENKRNAILSEPLIESQLADKFVSDIAGYPSSWLGITRFDIDEPARTDFVALNASTEPLWTSSGGSASFYPGGIEFNLSGTSGALELELAQFERFPYLYPQLADSVAITASGAELNQAKIYLINSQNEQILIGDADGVYRELSAANDSYYAGAWAQSFAADVTGYSETGTDLQANGVSASTMSDVERRTFFELFRAGHATKLRIEITVNSASTVNVSYPVFKHLPRRSFTVPEQSNVAAIVNNRGRLFRFCALNLHGDPAVRAVHEPGTVYDYARFRSLAWDADDSPTESWYDTIELEAIDDLKLGTRCFALPFVESDEPKFVLVNSLRELPPLACLPRRARDSNLIESGDWVQYSYSWCPRARYFINRTDALHLDRVEFDGGGSETSRVRLSAPGGNWNGWIWTILDVPVANNEIITRWDSTILNTPRWYYVHNVAGDLGRLTPFHGMTSVVSSAGKAGNWISYDVSGSGRHARSFVDIGSIWIGLASDRAAEAWTDRATNIAGQTPCVRWNRLRSQRLWIAYRAGSDIKLDSLSESGVSEMSIIVGDGEFPALVAGRDGRVFVYYVRESSIRGRIYDSLGNALTSEFTAIASADESPIAADEYLLSANAWRINLIYRVSGELQIASSPDGQNFS